MDGERYPGNQKRSGNGILTHEFNTNTIMKMLDDGEIARRIYAIAAALPDGSVASTSSLFRQVKIEADELLPVGTLLSVHNLLMRLISEGGDIRIEFDNSQEDSPMPQNRSYRIKREQD